MLEFKTFISVTLGDITDWLIFIASGLNTFSPLPPPKHSSPFCNLHALNSLNPRPCNPSFISITLYESLLGLRLIKPLFVEIHIIP